MSFYLESELGKRTIYHENGKQLGELLMGDDGFYAWWPPTNMQGCLPEYAIHYIYTALVALNFGKSAQLDEYFRKEAVNATTD